MRDRVFIRLDPVSKYKEICTLAFPKLPHAGMSQIRSKGLENLNVFSSQPRLLDTPSFINIVIELFGISI